MPPRFAMNAAKRIPQVPVINCGQPMLNKIPFCMASGMPGINWNKAKNSP